MFVRTAVAVIALAVVIAACATVTPMTAGVPEGWGFQGWTEPALEVAVPSSWSNNGEVDAGSIAPPDPSMGPKEATITELVNAIIAQGGYRTNLGGLFETTPSDAAPGYVEVLVERGEWADLDAFADHWEAASDGLARVRLGPASLPTGPVEVFEVDDVLESGHRLRARWYLFLLGDGRGMAIAVGTYDGQDTGEGGDAASLDDLRSFADRVIATLRVAP